MVIIKRSDNKIRFEGHTHPTICAAISSVMYTTVNALDKYDAHCVIFEDNVDEDYIEMRIIRKDTIVNMLLKNMFDMFNDIYEDGNQDKLRIIIE